MSDIEWKSTPMTGTEALQVLFIALKLLDKIDWSWWWVLAPTWGVVVIVIVLVVYHWWANKW